MYRKSIFFLVLMLLALLAWGQPRERVKQIRIGYLTEKIPLDTEDAQVFWPVYNAYAKEMETLRAEGKDRMMDAREQFDTMSDSELSQLADDYLGYKRKELAIMEKYHPRFKEVLSPRKLIRFYRAEQEFPVWLLRQFNNSRPGGGDFRPRNR